MLQASRTPAAAILLATFVAGTAYVYATRTDARASRTQSLTELEQAVANPDASTDTWLLYGQRLQQDQRFEHAVMAYQRVLETDPYSRTANIQCVAALSLLGDTDRLAGFLAHLIQLDPRLALDVFGRPEIQPHLRLERFQGLLNQARIQSLD